MSLKKHPEYKAELERLEYTVDYVKDIILAMDTKREQYNEELREAYIDFDFLDSSLSYVRIMMNSKFLERLENSYDGLVHAEKKPYFCRIDIKREGNSKEDKLYIGKIALPRADGDETPLVIDWRSPVASVYYDGNLGHVTYETPSGTHSGELLLKRQYIIKDGKLEDMMDVDFASTDEFLQVALQENKDNRLKDIVNTIQAEQNKIIRASISEPLIVQGAAGSGKTTIALHRIAYLIYTYEESFTPENFMIIAPNSLFLNYISEVLPELGVDQVEQTTFVDLVYDLTGVKYKLVSPDEKLEKLLVDGDENALIRDVSMFKGSLEFKEIIEKYVLSLEQDFVPQEDLKLEEYTILTAEEVNSIFLKDFYYLPIYSRIPRVKKILTSKLKKELNSIIEELEDDYDKRLNEVRRSTDDAEERREQLGILMDERDNKIESLKKTSKNAVKKYIALFPQNDALHYYRELATSPEKLQYFANNEINQEFLSYFCNYTKEVLAKKRVEFEDLTPLLYIQYKAFGFKKEMKAKHLVIDEAQDFSLFQIDILKEIFDTEMFTLLGDISQGIHSYRGMNDWNELREKVFTSGNSRYLTLEQSYRTTIEIMDLANDVLKLTELPGLVLAKPVVRHGEKPKVLRQKNQNETISALEKRVQDLKEKDYSTVAIICKTTKECTKLKKSLDKRGNIAAKQLNANDISYEGGIVILSAYHAKGLEFDAVIITTLEEDYEQTELDLKLLYVAMTRALHSLDVVCTGKTLSILNKTNAVEKG
ncbi:UvrD/Rep helicase family protein [Candidatus Syntrophocurvum alkaliphilum]|uniref:DNA 3'-5' helicase n=1 Tax=Candidatus Syntrophocurvum alkaliphilum TaxID=2293317 RepID=A0A6I6DGV2_9FIRM|nr:RNA polymerase recycling motor HelD [Candidatus Syntrophocurvum alkaliphilum]QGU00321.1 UvrD/Rep helicase family protein [Candidatus Syntrophocurvum alkaliphilum]